jgi:hypothetical protein
VEAMLSFIVVGLCVCLVMLRLCLSPPDYLFIRIHPKHTHTHTPTPTPSPPQKKHKHTHTQKQAWQARRILPLLVRHHHLLVTLLLFNSVAAEALPLALDELVPGYVAVRFTDIYVFNVYGRVYCFIYIIYMCVCHPTHRHTDAHTHQHPPPNTHTHEQNNHRC